MSSNWGWPQRSLRENGDGGFSGEAFGVTERGIMRFNAGVHDF